AGKWQNEQLVCYIAGDVTSIWLSGALNMMADYPVMIGWQQTGTETQLQVTASKATWLRFRCSQPNILTLNGQAAAYQYDALTGMVWLSVQPGTSSIALTSGSVSS
ncbi:MAG: hypothetical protein ACPG7F_16885, partial [Aggregatilineales bacterium]